MRFGLKNSSTNTFRNIAAGLLAAIMMAACGGGGGSSGSTTGGTSSGGSSTVATAAAINFVSAVPADKSIVIKGAGGNGRTESALLTFVVVDSANVGVAGIKVDFATYSTNPVALTSATGTTDASGKVVATLNSGTDPTTVRVTATVHGTAISTLSDTLTVTTGLPIQAAFSLSAESFNISGWDNDNEQTKVNILLADQSGNPVADGTPVVFQTDSGAIGSSSIGGCTTINGGCSVDFRSQKPRYGIGNAAGKVPGLATISVSTTSALFTLSGNIGIYLSGDDAVNVRKVNVTPPNTLLTQNVTNLTTSSCGNFSLRLSLADINENPMPENTTIESANPTDVTVGEIIPAAVPNTTVASVHTILVKPDSTKCNVAGTGTATGTFDVKIKSPLGVPKLYSFSLTYPM